MIDGCDCRNSWKVVSSDTSACNVHNKIFLTKNGCPKYISENITPSLSSCGAKVQAKNDVSNSQTKKVIFEHKKVISSKAMVISLNEKGYTQSQIALELGVSQPYVSKVLGSLRLGSDKRERFHNFSLTFNAVFDYGVFPFKDITLKHTSYKKWSNDDFQVSIFRNGRILVRYVKDIFGLKIVDSEKQAVDNILAFIQEWNVYGVRFIDYYVSSGHNEFMNSEIARGVASKGQRIVYCDRVDRKVRTTIDFSPTPGNPSGSPMFEHEHSRHYKPDSMKWEQILDDVACDNYDPLSVTKAKLDSLYGVLDDVKNNALIPLKNQTEALREQLSVHLPVERGARDALVEDTIIRRQQLEVQSETLRTLRAIQGGVSSKSGEFVCDSSWCVPVDSLCISRYDDRRVANLKLAKAFLRNAGGSL